MLQIKSHHSFVRASLVASIMAALLLPGVSNAASTDISSEPLITMPDVKAKPNLMFILDSSGSMNDETMPDQQGTDSGLYGFSAAQCNGLAYNPNTTYKPPVDSTGTPFSNATFSAAWDSGFDQSGSTTNLATTGSRIAQVGTSSSVTVAMGSKTFAINSSDVTLQNGTFSVGQTIVLTGSSGRSMSGTVTAWTRASNSSGTLTVNVGATAGSGSTSTWSIYRGARYYSYTGSQPARSWSFDSGGSVIQNTFYNECRSNIGSTPGSNVFTPVYVTAASNDATNYANWYSYYRKRILLMQTAVGRAFSGLDSSYRIGFTTIRDTGITDGTNNFRNIKTFDTTQKANFYSSLYTETPSDYTPLRASLSKVGRYYAKKISGQTYDPVEYACQRNYTILSTDGYWNDNIETGGYVPKDLAGNAVGNQDWNEARPMYDGATAVGLLNRDRYVVVRGTGTGRRGNGCATTTYLVTTTPQTSSNNGTTWTNGSSSSACVAGSTVVVNSQTASQLNNQTVYSATTSNATYSGGSSDSLADVAEYYYKTDLRDASLNNCTSSTSGSSQNVCGNIVPTSGRDTAEHQHMTTFTIGLGVSGTLAYDKNYLNQVPSGSGAYRNLTDGPTNWPIVPTGNYGNVSDARKIDDMWHAAVNGRGQYYSALNAEELQTAITGVVNQIQAENGAASAAITNRLELVAGGGNYAYEASYTTANWIGDVQAFSVDSATGALGTTAVWSAQALLDAATPSARNIYFSNGGTLAAFTNANLTTAGKSALFSNLCSKSVVASQCSGLTSAQLTLANTDANLVGFLRGDRGYETSNNVNPLYRARQHVLGDIINSSPVYVGAPLFSYTDTGYAAFKAGAAATRTAVVYVGANDGMLHAFNAATGSELWAFVPTAVLPNLYKLADSSYASRHTYFVDGAPVVGDVYDSATSSWKTILVGGLNAGGNAYYALDITNPASPILLWEFTDNNLGQTFGNPMIVKRDNGTWVVVFASGYNNTAGDGQGHLYVVNAITGAKQKTVSGTTNLDVATATGVGSSTDPSGLAKINAWIADATDNSALRFYGGDLKGNLWRFDIDDLVAPNHSALRLAQFQTSAGDPEAITIQPRLKLVSGQAVVILGTGQYLGTTDIADTKMQGVAVIRDPLTNAGWGVVRNNSAVKVSTVTLVDPNANTLNATATLVDDDAIITASSPVVTWSTDGGWRFDLPIEKERVVTPIAIAGNTMLVASAIPNGDACTTGGASRLYICDIPTGGCTGELYSESSLIVGMTVLTTDTGAQVVLIRDSTGRTITKPLSPDVVPPSGTAHRTSWRELVD
jgi:type IV pilus assembly protein PilY1